MNSVRRGFRIVSAVGLTALLFLTGCATQRVDWAGRVGTYTYDEAIMDYGPPEKTAKLSDGSTVAEWLTHRGYSYAYSPFNQGFYYPYAFPAFYPGYLEMVNVPNYYLRLAFDPENRLKAWKKVSK